MARFALPFLILVHTVFLAVRRTVGDVTELAAFDRLLPLIFAGRLAELRAGLANALPSSPVASGVAEALLDAVIAVEAEDPPRVFTARVALLGHKYLGVCRVEEVTLGGAKALRCTELYIAGTAVHWVLAKSIYCLTEISEAEAQAEANAQREARAYYTRASEELLAFRREGRGNASVDVQRVGQFVRLIAQANGCGTPGMLEDSEVQAALFKVGYSGDRHYDGNHWLGVTDGYLNADDAEQAATPGSPLCEALRAVGFATVTVLPALAAPVGANDVAVTW